MINMLKRVVTIFFLVVLGLRPLTVVEASIDMSYGDVDRISGDNRVETSVVSSRINYPNGAKTAILVGFNGIPDALSGTILSEVENAPIMVTRSSYLSNEIEKELLRLSAEKVIIIGGSSSVSEGVQNQLIKSGFSTERIDGSNRIETSILINERVSDKVSERAIIISGWGPNKTGSSPDALSSSAVSGKLMSPIFLTDGKKIEDRVLKSMDSMGITSATIIGGESVVSDSIEKSLSKRYKTDRVWGSNRENTAIAVYERFFENSGDNVVFVNGGSYADSAVAGYTATKNNSPIFLIQKDNAGANLKGILSKSDISGGFVMGGEVIVSENTREELMNSIMNIESANASKPISIQTPPPHSSMKGQTTHPDVAYIESGWNGHKYWMAHTPYHNTNEKVENPSVSYSDDGVNFMDFPSSTNPIDSPKAGGLEEYNSHMSDTDMIIRDDGVMEVYYRYRNRAKGEGETIFRKTSSDAINWSEREVVMRGSSDSGKDILSPSIIYEDGLYKMWWVQNTTVMMSTSKSAVEDTWSTPVEVPLNFKGKTMSPWHLDVFKEGENYYILLNVNETDINSRRSLTIGSSKDGTYFENIKTIMRPTINNWDNRDVYRGSIIKVDGVYKLYYSAMSNDRRWHVGLSKSKDLLKWTGE